MGMQVWENIGQPFKHRGKLQFGFSYRNQITRSIFMNKCETQEFVVCGGTKNTDCPSEYIIGEFNFNFNLNI